MLNDSARYIIHSEVRRRTADNAYTDIINFVDYPNHGVSWTKRGDYDQLCIDLVACTKIIGKCYRCEVKYQLFIYLPLKSVC